MFRKNDNSYAQKEQNRTQHITSKQTTQSGETNPISEGSSVRARLRERFPKLFGSKKNKVIPVVNVDKEELVPMRLIDIDATVFAHELTMLDKEMFCNIELKEVISGKRNDHVSYCYFHVCAWFVAYRMNVACRMSLVASQAQVRYIMKMIIKFLLQRSGIDKNNLKKVPLLLNFFVLFSKDAAKAAV
jgi:hypothetical protein